MTLISACMMLKNEEENLPRALESIKGLVDEIIVVDTGSTDRTVEIAKSYGAKVYHHPWQNNFSLHRNQSIGYATGEWVLIIDADNELVFADGYDAEAVKRDFKKLHEKVGAVVILTQDIQHDNTAMQFQSAKFFRRSSGIEYKRRVHNRPVYKGKTVFYEPICMKHYGYGYGPERMAAKQDRTLGLIQEHLKDEPDDYESYFYLNQMYSLKREHEKCLEAGETYYQNKDKLDRFNPTVFFTCARSAMALQDRKAAASWVMRGIQAYPDNLDIQFALIELGAAEQNGDFIERGATKYVELYSEIQQHPEKLGGFFCFTMNENSLIYAVYMLSMVKLKMGANYLHALKDMLSVADNNNYAKKMRGHILQDLNSMGDLTALFTSQEQAA